MPDRRNRTLRRCGLALSMAFALAMPGGVLAASPLPAAFRFGVMLHYLPGKGQAVAWRQADIDALAHDLSDMGADYLVLTLGQNNGQFISPNPALVEICPSARASEPAQDLPMEIAQALKARRIGLILYLPFRAPQGDAYLMECLGDRNEQLATSSRFVDNWSAVIAAWSARYGGLVDGWWFDGVYNTSGMSPRDWAVLCAAAGRGAQGRLLAFNAGEGLQRFRLRSSPCQNLMAGELMEVPTGLDAQGSDLRFHVLTPLTATWGRPGAARFSARDLQQRMADARAAHGMLTLDMPLSSGRRLAPEQVALVKSASAAAPAGMRQARP